MNKNILLALVASGVLTAVGCQNNSAHQNDSTPQNQFRINEKVFNGVIPCADCDGIETTLQLSNDGTYILGQTYLKSGQEKPFFETGHWIVNGKKINLTSDEGEKAYYQMTGKDLVMLDIRGEPIQSELNYKLAKVTPRKLAGEYRYFADSATFIECHSGKFYDASENIELERGYSATGVEGEKPVYVEVEGYYTLRPSMEDGLFDNALIQTGKIRFDKSSSCQTKK
ncbi:envelope stress response activation lipoprotein NlpE [Xenorhabdus cabanillasii]|uniref:Outer membrane lipoprotein, involved in copper homeostasis and in adhesion n=2 Tax=Xenorhabdus cabanillasii TaxID=351673 RepID=W1IQ18_9GAMM|nr:envelope stress response activation lipoprotein NlpE [Xenorhabdus cabanillasii]PHM79078.1 copper homeostasis/adhesion lipoprotein NlpE [Xenorhabdus cabanillasii JM26]CDL79325.1 Outer membrane lipoprotein, involved in copper homeostasis and in adhesion [Xenorhabdus cabanillasii JM26]